LTRASRQNSQQDQPPVLSPKVPELTRKSKRLLRTKEWSVRQSERAYHALQVDRQDRMMREARYRALRRAGRPGSFTQTPRANMLVSHLATQIAKIPVFAQQVREVPGFDGFGPRLSEDRRVAEFVAFKTRVWFRFQDQEALGPPSLVGIGYGPPERVHIGNRPGGPSGSTSTGARVQSGTGNGFPCPRCKKGRLSRSRPICKRCDFSAYEVFRATDVLR
jgi:hypothetical protein